MWDRISKPHMLQDVPMQFGSDYHYTLGTSIDVIVGEILNEYIPGNILCLHGDIFNSPTGIDSSPEINEVLKELSKHVEQIIFVPGNHDLRGRDKPWETFNIPENVLYPHSPENPLITTIGNTRICIAHLFFDFTFIDTPEPSLSEKVLRDFYTGLPDGKFLMNGNTDIFEPTKNTLRSTLDSKDIDVLITHVPPHPSLVTIMGDIVINDPSIKRIHDVETSIRLHAHEEYMEASLKDHSLFINYRNKKGAMLGANVFDKITLKKPLISIYGHNHAGDTRSQIEKDNQSVTFITGPQPWIDRHAH